MSAGDFLVAEGVPHELAEMDHFDTGRWLERGILLMLPADS